MIFIKKRNLANYNINNSNKIKAFFGVFNCLFSSIKDYNRLSSPLFINGLGDFFIALSKISGVKCTG